MVNYKCKNCGKEFKKKDDFIKHTEKKKKPCQINKIILYQYNKDSTENTQNSTENTQNSTEVINKSSDELEKNSKDNIFCIYCKLNFTRKDSLKRHMKNNCKVKKLD